MCTLTCVKQYRYPTPDGAGALERELFGEETLGGVLTVYARAHNMSGCVVGVVLVVGTDDEDPLSTERDGTDGGYGGEVTREDVVAGWGEDVEVYDEH